MAEERADTIFMLLEKLNAKSVSQISKASKNNKNAS